ncbi:MAG TPA: hypothetical protein QGG59_03410 [Planctomycetota bacterium]|nr:hypothetical protein [Planctomycetota bacterium]
MELRSWRLRWGRFFYGLTVADQEVLGPCESVINGLSSEWRGYPAADMFTAADFELYQPRFQGDPEWNGRRLDIRHRLQAMGDQLKAEFAGLGSARDRRESRHNPHHTNGKKVRRQRTMLFRDKKARASLKKFLGKELGKDLDSARNNLHFQVGLDAKEAWWGLRVDEGAWYDLNVLLKRAEDGSGQSEIVAACAEAQGFDLELNRGGARPVCQMDSRDWRDLAGVVRPGETQLDLVRRMPAHEVAEMGEGFDEKVISDLVALAPFFELVSWTLDGPSGASL